MRPPTAGDVHRMHIQIACDVAQRMTPPYEFRHSILYRRSELCLPVIAKNIAPLDQ